MDILFSIIIPTYNRAHTLDRAIRSVLTQTYSHFELLIVDDGSTDNTEEIVGRIADERICYFKKKNEERNIARNFGVDRAQGDYICFLDSDDYLLPNHFQTAFCVVKRCNRPEVFHLGYQVVDKNNRVLSTSQDITTNIDMALIEENLLSCNAIFLRRNVASLYRFIPSRKVVISEDWYVWLRLASRFRIHIDNTVTSVIVEHEERSLREVSPDKLIRSTQVIIDYLNRDKVFLKKYGKRVRYFYANMYTLVTLVLALSKNRKQEVAYYLYQALRWDWRVIVRRRFLASVKHFF